MTQVDDEECVPLGAKCPMIVRPRSGVLGRYVLSEGFQMYDSMHWAIKDGMTEGDMEDLVFELRSRQRSPAGAFCPRGSFD